MKISKYSIIAILIAFVLFVIPFFWLKPGEMDLGGDNSRLYFYDPLSYLTKHSIYGVVPTGIGGEAISYFAIPYLFLLVLLKAILGSPTTLISFFNGLSLSVSFFAIYAIVIELIKGHYTQKDENENLTKTSALLAGLFYVFSPFAILGWDRALFIHNQIFLNPLAFLLLLKYFLTHNTKYLTATLLLTFIFSPNFTYGAAPAFFAFYPLALLFLVIYTRYIRKSPIPIKGLCIGAIAFSLLHGFHLIPQLMSLFTAGSSVNQAVFSEKVRLSRGLDYFASIAPSIKTSISVMALPQVTKLGFTSFGFIIFPAVVLLAMFYSRRKTLLLTGAFFLIVTFFYSANVTQLGFNFYKTLFYIPGFSMFRNFYGQWGFIYMFFYALLFGQACFIVFNRWRRQRMYIFIFFVVGLLSINAWPFINGSFIRLTLHESKGVKPVIEMNPTFEEVFRYVRDHPVDGKILSLPLVDPGYHVFAGKNGGAYVGPSAFSYLGGKNDFAGYEGLLPFSEFFLHAARDNDSQAIKKLFSILNIRYVFYNSDPYIFDDTFPGFPYGYVRAFLPKKQEEYKIFIQKLPLSQKIDFGDTYHLYDVEEDAFLPHIYTATESIKTNNPLLFLDGSLINEYSPFAIFNIRDAIEDPTIILEAKNNTPLSEILNNYHLHRHEPFISLRLEDIYYPLALLKENFEIWKARNDYNKFIDFNLFYLSKRIFELQKWREKMPILRVEQKEPDIWEFYKLHRYNSWETSLIRYEKGMGRIIQWVNNATLPITIRETDKIKINEQLLQHQKMLSEVLEKRIEEEERVYLSTVIDEVFKRIFQKLNLDFYNPSFHTYSVEIPKNYQGEYEIYLDTKGNTYEHLSEASIEIDGKLLKPKGILQGSLLQFDNVAIQGEEEQRFFTLRLPLENLVKDIKWQNSGESSDTEGVAQLTMYNATGDNAGGLIKAVEGLLPNRQYIISFEYITLGDTITFRASDTYAEEKNKRKTGQHVYFEKNLNSVDWKRHQSIFTLDPKSQQQYINFFGGAGKEKSTLFIRNLNIVEVKSPKIFLKKVAIKEAYSAPRIVFTKVNPTKYKVTVRDAQSPYTLVFLEAFDSKWQLINPQKDKKTFNALLERLFAFLMRNGVEIFVKDQASDRQIVSRHLHGTVEEEIHTNIFLAPSTFATWGKEAVSQVRHFRVNGYANGWNILPEDMDGKEEYELIIELQSQRFFYILLAVSVATFGTTLAFFIKNILKR